ncbi:MAG: DUF1292 domain-containing protein [Pararoseburia sp.]|nr:DUF1292 domain-containing protein [Lachnospiraceae bacterium]MDY4793293.1 DUF1292 domain-containing protein [Pararoseburia sp.]
MDSITLIAPDTQEDITVYVLEETTLNENKYLLVTEDSEGDTEAFILKEIAEDDTDVTYEIVEDDLEFNAVVKVFEELVEDTDFEMD